MWVLLLSKDVCVGTIKKHYVEGYMYDENDGKENTIWDVSLWETGIKKFNA